MSERPAGPVPNPVPVPPPSPPGSRGLMFRHPAEDDFPRVQEALTSWWGGLGGEAGAAQRRFLVPRLFFQHFTTTSLIAEDPDGRLAGFLIGFLSQSHADEAYIHFVGVRPERRAGGVGRELYERFFAIAAAHGRVRVRCITGPANRASIAYHTHMGFRIEDGPEAVDGVPVFPDYDGVGTPRVRFVRDLPASAH